MKEDRLPKALQAELRNLREKVKEYESRAQLQAADTYIRAGFYTDAPIGIPTRLPVTFILDSGNPHLEQRIEIRFRSAPSESHNAPFRRGCLYLQSVGGTLRMTPHVSNAISIEVVE